MAQRWSQTGFYFRLLWCPIFLSPGFSQNILCRANFFSTCEKSEQIPFKDRNAARSIKKFKETPRFWHGVLVLPHHHMCHQMSITAPQLANIPGVPSSESRLPSVLEMTQWSHFPWVPPVSGVWGAWGVTPGHSTWWTDTQVTWWHNILTLW